MARAKQKRAEDGNCNVLTIANLESKKQHDAHDPLLPANSTDLATDSAPRPFYNQQSPKRQYLQPSEPNALPDSVSSVKTETIPSANMTHLTTEDAGANEASYATVAAAVPGPPPNEEPPVSKSSATSHTERIPEKRREHSDRELRGVQRSLFPALQGPKSKKKLRKRKTVQESTSESDDSDPDEEAEFAKLMQLHAERAKTTTAEGIIVVNGELDSDAQKEIESKLDQKRILRENTHFNKLIPPTLPQVRLKSFHHAFLVLIITKYRIAAGKASLA